MYAASVAEVNAFIAISSPAILNTFKGQEIGQEIEGDNEAVRLGNYLIC